MRPFILFAEDNAELAELIGIACERAGLPQSAYLVCRNGFEVVSYLQRAELRESSLPIPCRIVTDLDMPIFNGLDVLEWLQGSPRFKNIPVTVVTASAEPDSMARAESLGCSEFLHKWAAFKNFTGLLEEWCNPSRSTEPLEAEEHRENICQHFEFLVPSEA